MYTYLYNNICNYAHVLLQELSLIFNLAQLKGDGKYIDWCTQDKDHKQY